MSSEPSGTKARPSGTFWTSATTSRLAPAEPSPAIGTKLTCGASLSTTARAAAVGRHRHAVGEIHLGAAPGAAFAGRQIEAEDRGAGRLALAVRDVEIATRLIDHRIVRHADSRRGEAAHLAARNVPAEDGGMLEIAAEDVAGAIEGDAEQEAARAAHALDRGCRRRRAAGGRRSRCRTRSSRRHARRRLRDAPPVGSLKMPSKKTRAAEIGSSGFMAGPRLGRWDRAHRQGPPALDQSAVGRQDLGDQRPALAWRRRIPAA